MVGDAQDDQKPDPGWYNSRGSRERYGGNFKQTLTLV